MLTASPVDVTATAVFSGISLAWTTSPGVTYDVYRGAYSTGESATPLMTGDATGNFLDPNADLVSGHDYYYTVTAVAGTVQSSPSSEVFAYAPGAYQSPTVDFNNGIPASASSAFTAVNSIFNSDNSVTVGTSLEYDTPVNTKQFNVQFEVQQPIATNPVSLSMELEAPNGKTVTIFDGTQINFATDFGSAQTDEYLVQFSYSQILSQGVVEQYVVNGGQGASGSPTLNIPALLGSDIAYPVFFSNSAGQTPRLQNFYYMNSFAIPLSNPTATATAQGIDLHFPTTQLGSNSQSVYLGPIEERIFRGTRLGGEGLAPIGIATLGSDFVDTTAVPGQTYYYVADGGEGANGPVLGVSGTYIEDGGSGAATIEVSATIPAVQQPTQLTGTPIGTSGSWNGASTIDQAFDNNLSTYFDPADGTLTNWVGLDLGKATTITQIKYAPRAGYEFRMLDGQFQVSNTADFSSGVQTVYTITTTPVAGQLTTVSLNLPTGYRYIRYTGGLQWVNIAEMQVFGLQLSPPTSIQDFAGNPIGVGGAWSSSSTYAQAFDGDTLSFFDPANGSLTNWVGLDLVTPVTITQISFAPRPGYGFRMVGGEFQVSSTPDFSSDVHTLYTVTAPPVAGMITTVNIEPVGAYRYVRYTGGTQWVNIAEMQVAGVTSPVPLSGTPIGVGGGWVPSSGYTAAFDGSTSTYFDPANGRLTNWTGLDLGTAETITQISYVARAGYEFRMVGAEIQVSSTPDFSANVQTIYTITSAPPAGQVVTIEVTPVSARYIRYIGGTQWVNIAELEVDGL